MRMELVQHFHHSLYIKNTFFSSVQYLPVILFTVLTWNRASELTFAPHFISLQMMIG